MSSASKQTLQDAVEGADMDDLDTAAQTIGEARFHLSQPLLLPRQSLSHELAGRPDGLAPCSGADTVPPRAACLFQRRTPAAVRASLALRLSLLH